nr:MAG TPA: hypothetical protein [Caudoviricetes sp.]
MPLSLASSHSPFKKMAQIFSSCMLICVYQK